MEVGANLVQKRFSIVDFLAQCYCMLSNPFCVAAPNDDLKLQEFFVVNASASQFEFPLGAFLNSNSFLLHLF